MGAAVGLLVMSAFWRVHSLGSLLSLLGQLALVAGATWVFAEMAKRYRQQEDAALAVVRALNLERDGTGEAGNVGYVPTWAAGRREEIVARLRAHLDPSLEFVDG